MVIFENTRSQDLKKLEESLKGFSRETNHRRAIGEINWGFVAYGNEIHFEIKKPGEWFLSAAHYVDATSSNAIFSK